MPYEMCASGLQQVFYSHKYSVFGTKIELKSW